MEDFDTKRYQAWVGKRVALAVNIGSGPSAQCVELEGELKVVHERGIMVRPKGRMSHEMIAPDQIERFELADEKIRPIVPKRVPHVAFGSIRQHLADRHGFSLKQLNNPAFDENVAYDAHIEDHAPNADPMSHYHEG